LLPYLQATYEDGYVLTEDETDHSPFDSNKNIFHAILNSRPCGIHGKMTRLVLVCDVNTFVIDWTLLPDNARPIRFKNMSRRFLGTMPIEEPQVNSTDFGFQYTSEDGNYQSVINVTIENGEEIVTDVVIDEDVIEAMLGKP
jgi:hypothetical protein